MGLTALSTGRPSGYSAWVEVRKRAPDSLRGPWGGGGVRAHPLSPLSAAPTPLFPCGPQCLSSQDNSGRVDQPIRVPGWPRVYPAPRESPGRQRAGLGPGAGDPLASAQSLQRPPLRPRPGAPPRKSMPPLLPPGPIPRFPPRPRVLTDIRQIDESEERLALGPTLGTGVCVISLRRRRKFGLCDGGARPGAEVAGGGRE